MLKKYSLFFLFFFSTATLAAQEKPKTIEDRRSWANEVYKKAVISNDSLLLAEAYYLFGKIEMITTHSYFSTKLWFLKSLWILEEIEPSYELSRVHFWLGRNEELYSNYEQELFHLRKGVEIAEKNQIERAMSSGYYTLTVHFANRNNGHYNADSMNYYYKKTIELAKKSNNTTTRELLNLAIKESEAADKQNIEQLKLAIKELGVSAESTPSKALALVNLANAYIRTNDLESALIYIKEAEKAAAMISFHLTVENNIRKAYINYYEKKGDLNNAYRLLKELKEEDDFRKVKERNGNISNLKRLFESEQRELANQKRIQEIALYKENSSLQKKLLWGAAFLIVLIALIAYQYFALNRKNIQISQQNALLVREQNHRFNNNIQVISDLLMIKSQGMETLEMQDILDESNQLLQAISTLQKKLYSGEKLVSVELHQVVPEIVSNVLSAFNQASAKVSCTIEEPIEIKGNDALTLNLIINEITANACKHAFYNHPSPALKIHIFTQEDQLIVRFKDNGTQQEHPESKSNSFGLRLVSLLVSQLKGSYKYYFDNGWNFEMVCKVEFLHTKETRKRFVLSKATIFPYG